MDYDWFISHDHRQIFFIFHHRDKIQIFDLVAFELIKTRQRKRFGQLMKALISSFDRIVIDSPPLMSVTDAQIMAASADATLLVLRMNRSARSLGAVGRAIPATAPR